jgi:hypothetical protein
MPRYSACRSTSLFTRRRQAAAQRPGRFVAHVSMPATDRGRLAEFLPGHVDRPPARQRTEADSVVRRPVERLATDGACLGVVDRETNAFQLVAIVDLTRSCGHAYIHSTTGLATMNSSQSLRGPRSRSVASRTYVCSSL